MKSSMVNRFMVTLVIFLLNFNGKIYASKEEKIEMCESEMTQQVLAIQNLQDEFKMIIEVLTEKMDAQKITHEETILKLKNDHENEINILEKENKKLKHDHEITMKKMQKKSMTLYLELEKKNISVKTRIMTKICSALKNGKKKFSSLLKYLNMILPALLHITPGFIMQFLNFALRKFTHMGLIDSLYLDLPMVAINCLLLIYTPYRWSEYYKGMEGEKKIMVKNILPHDPVFYVQPILMALAPIILNFVRNKRLGSFLHHVHKRDKEELSTKLLHEEPETQLSELTEIEEQFVFEMYMKSPIQTTSMGRHIFWSFVTMVLKLANCFIPGMHDPRSAGGPYMFLSLAQAAPADIETYVLLLLQNICAMYVFEGQNPSHINLDWQILVGLSIFWNLVMSIGIAFSDFSRLYSAQDHNII